MGAAERGARTEFLFSGPKSVYADPYSAVVT